MGENLPVEHNQDSNADKSVALVQTSEYFSGPLPHPTILEKYETIHPGLADRIMKMAESQSDHRKDLEKKVILHDRAKSWAGIVFGFIIVIVAFSIGGYLLMHDKPIGGLFMGLAPLGTIVGVFIYQNKKKG